MEHTNRKTTLSRYSASQNIGDGITDAILMTKLCIATSKSRQQQLKSGEKDDLAPDDRRNLYMPSPHSVVEWVLVNRKRTFRRIEPHSIAVVAEVCGW